MSKQKRLFAEPVSELRSFDTQELVGWLYRWNNGDMMEAWAGQPRGFRRTSLADVPSE